MFEPLSASSRWFSRFLVAGAATLVVAALVCGQQPAGAGGSSDSSKPDSPKPKQEAASESSRGGSRFIGYATSGSIIFPDIATNPFPLSAGGKFKVFVNQAISPAYIFASALSAAKNQATNSPGSTGQGWDAYGTRVGYSMARASSQAFFGNFVFASILHEDPRFFPENHPSFGRAVKYSVKRLFVTRSDNGNDVFNASAFLGPLAAEALSNAYYPVHEQTGARTAERYGSDIAWHLAGNMFKEYWPTVFRDVHLKAIKVIPDPNH